MFYALIEIMKSESGTRIIADILVGLLPSVCEFYFSKLVILLLFNILEIYLVHTFTIGKKFRFLHEMTTHEYHAPQKCRCLICHATKHY